MSSPLLEQYVPIVGRETVEQLYRLAERLQGKRVVMVNSARQGGGVAEILTRLVPLMNELGIECRWEVIEGDNGFYGVTKAFHNSLQGQASHLRDDDFHHYLEVNRRNAARLDLDADAVIIHDPQPAALIDYAGGNGARWVWRCHIDVAHPERRVWKFLQRYIVRYDASIFSMPRFSQNLPHPQYIINPSIDPLSEKNRDMTPDEVREVWRGQGLGNGRPTILQVSRFDRFKDPLGVIRAFELVRKETECQLVLAGGGATDDPEGEQVLGEVRQAASGNPDIRILLLPSDANLTINALQRGAAIAVQKSVKEGFGLTVTEAMWKGHPVVGGAVGGIALQIYDHHTGFLVHSVEGAAYRIRYLLNRPEAVKRMGVRAREFVRRHFLLTRQLRDNLLLLINLDHPRERVIFV
jgi:trehalose synthase